MNINVCRYDGLKKRLEATYIIITMTLTLGVKS